MEKIILQNCCVLFIFMISILVAAQDSSNIELNTSLGRIKGSFMTTRLGRRIYSFRGIRYAEPPVGQRRFKVQILSIKFTRNKMFLARKYLPVPR